MKTSDFNDPLKEAFKHSDNIINAVIKRGYDDVSEETDDYKVLLQKYEFRKLVIFSIYEGYFPPKRHEFELQLLTELIDAVASSKTGVFLVSATVGGIVGNAAYDMLKKALGHVLHRLKKIKRTRDAFQEIINNIERIHKYFQKHDHVSTDDICSDLKIEAHKIEPLLKLLGFKYKRRGKRQKWIRPKS